MKETTFLYCCQLGTQYSVIYCLAIMAEVNKPMRQNSNLAIVVHALVVSRLTYFNVLCRGLPLKTAGNYNWYTMLTVGD